MSYYLQSKGDKYKSHYATILNWARKEKQQPKKETREELNARILRELEEEKKNERD